MPGATPPVLRTPCHLRSRCSVWQLTQTHQASRLMTGRQAWWCFPVVIRCFCATPKTVSYGLCEALVFAWLLPAYAPTLYRHSPNRVSLVYALASCRRGVATITGLCIFRQDTPAASQQQEPKSADTQPQQLLVWPECDPCDDLLVQQALQPAEPVNRLPLPLSVLPSNMPAELLMTFQGEVSAQQCTCRA